MSNERFFRMLSIALLGALALACVPDSEASSPVASRISALGATLMSADVLPVEVQVVNEIDEINAGRFNPAVAGGAKGETAPAAQKLSQVDPNF